MKYGNVFITFEKDITEEQFKKLSSLLGFDLIISIVGKNDDKIKVCITCKNEYMRTLVESVLNEGIGFHEKS